MRDNETWLRQSGRSMRVRRCRWPSLLALISLQVFAFVGLVAADSRGSKTVPSGIISDGADSSTAMDMATGTDQIPRAPTGKEEAESTSFSGANNSIIAIGGIGAQVQNANQSWSLTSPEDQTLRFEVHPGDHWSNLGWSDLSNNDAAERSEIELEPRFESGTTIGVSYGFMIEAGAENTSPWLVIGQFHQTNASGPPPFAIAMKGEQMQIIIRNVPSIERVVYRDPNPIQRGRYYFMSIEVKFDDKRNGALNVWRDGVPIVRYQGEIGYGRGETYYWKEGIYRARGSNASIAAVYKDLRVSAARPNLPRE